MWPETARLMCYATSPFKAGYSLLIAQSCSICNYQEYGGADKSLARPGGKQATATEDFDFHVTYLLS